MKGKPTRLGHKTARTQPVRKHVRAVCTWHSDSTRESHLSYYHPSYPAETSKSHFFTDNFLLSHSSAKADLVLLLHFSRHFLFQKLCFLRCVCLLPNTRISNHQNLNKGNCLFKNLYYIASIDRTGKT